MACQSCSLICWCALRSLTKVQQVMKSMKGESKNQCIWRKRLGANSPGNVGRQGQTLRAKGGKQLMPFSCRPYQIHLTEQFKKHLRDSLHLQESCHRIVSSPQQRLFTIIYTYSFSIDIISCIIHNKNIAALPFILVSIPSVSTPTYGKLNSEHPSSLETRTIHIYPYLATVANPFT